jgi:hypothetical protein
MYRALYLANVTLLYTQALLFTEKGELSFFWESFILCRRFVTVAI